MRRSTLMTVTLMSLPFMFSSLAAQAHPLVGAWSVNYAAGMRHENGELTPIMATGTLTVAVAGDSLVATLVANPIDGAPARPPTRMAAATPSGDVTFVVQSIAQLNINGEMRQATSVSTYLLKVSGDKLEGTVERRLEGLEGIDIPSAGPHPITGTRAKP